MTMLEVWELLSYVVTVVGLPLAIAVFLYEQRKERENEEEEVFQLLSDNYQDFLKIALENPDLKLFSLQQATGLSEEQLERKRIIFTMLVSLFERAYLLLYEDDMAAKQQRRQRRNIKPRFIKTRLARQRRDPWQMAAQSRWRPCVSCSDTPFGL